jgi:hypothetical protein
MHDSGAGFCEHGDDLSRCTKDGFLSLSKQLSALKTSFVSRNFLGNYSVIAYGVICSSIQNSLSDIDIDS